MHVSTENLCALSLITVAVDLSIVTYVYHVLTSLIRGVQFNLGSRNNSNINILYVIGI